MEGHIPWCSPDKKVFVIPGMSPDVMRILIEFAYTGSVSVTVDNVQELLLAADQLGVLGVVKTCCDFLGERLGEENCVGIFRFTDVVYCPELQRRAHRYMVGHFEAVARHEEFPLLSLQQLVAVLERDDLNVSDERVAFEAVLRWIHHLPEEREAHVAVLLSKVRLALMSMDYMQLKVLSNELVNTNTECRPMVRDAMDHIRTRKPSFDQLSNPLARPRLPNAVLLAIGGWSRDNATNVVEAYDVRSDYWISLTDDHEQPRAFHGSAVLNGSLYSIGGFYQRERLNSVRRLDLSTQLWHEAASMCQRRCFLSVAVLGQCIYALGGFDGFRELRSAERYRPEVNQWSLIAPMREKRSHASSTTLHNKVYICGGFDGRECLQTAECYIPEADQWTTIARMSGLRGGHGVVAYAGRVYVVGGFDNNYRLNTAEAYDAANNSWQQVASMLAPREHFGIGVLDNRIFVAGGYDGFTTYSNVESYDATTNEWTEACGMDMIRYALSCCVVSGLPNVAEYVVPRDALPFYQYYADNELS
ncbi:Kelch-like protein 10 [Liparis tanakae]|uniref:Kelch-like protein 10 n=1 Tax=Liparis tanakae TaxID=230148 RepID=A0A4Z2FQN3_9TELE|nr:Kelch-like protein 10 [Liparis tanakae]